MHRHFHGKILNQTFFFKSFIYHLISFFQKLINDNKLHKKYNNYNLRNKITNLIKLYSKAYYTNSMSG